MSLKELLDYLGTTVDVAARLEPLSSRQEVVITVFLADAGPSHCRAESYSRAA